MSPAAVVLAFTSGFAVGIGVAAACYWYYYHREKPQEQPIPGSRWGSSNSWSHTGYDDDDDDDVYEPPPEKKLAALNISIKLACNPNIQEAASSAIDEDPELREMLQDIDGEMEGIPLRHRKPHLE